MKAIFLADAHLKNPSDQGYKKCVHFFSELHGRGVEGVNVNEVDLIVIAGDFFDFWFERNGRIYPEFRTIVSCLERLKNEGVRICICEGNHDFFLADFFASRLGIEVYPEALELSIDDLRIFVSHGDTVDTKNSKYLVLRRLLRSSFIYRVQRIVPLSLLFAIARASSGMSREMVIGHQGQLVETMRHFADDKFRAGYDAVILGHSHAETLNRTELSGKRRIFATLGDWMTLYTYLAYEDGRFSLHNFDKPGKTDDL